MKIELSERGLFAICIFLFLCISVIAGAYCFTVQAATDQKAGLNAVVVDVNKDSIDAAAESFKTLSKKPPRG